MKYQEVFDTFSNLFFKLYNVRPEINYAECTSLLNERTKNNTEETVIEIIKMFFIQEPNDRVFHLPIILSAYNFNKYLPKLTKNPDIYV